MVKTQNTNKLFHFPSIQRSCTCEFNCSVYRALEYEIVSGKYVLDFKDLVPLSLCDKKNTIEKHESIGHIRFTDLIVLPTFHHKPSTAPPESISKQSPLIFVYCINCPHWNSWPA